MSAGNLDLYTQLLQACGEEMGVLVMSAWGRCCDIPSHWTCRIRVSSGLPVSAQLIAPVCEERLHGPCLEVADINAHLGNVVYVAGHQHGSQMSTIVNETSCPEWCEVGFHRLGESDRCSDMIFDRLMFDMLDASRSSAASAPGAEFRLPQVRLKAMGTLACACCAGAAMKLYAALFLHAAFIQKAAHEPEITNHKPIRNSK